MYYITACKQSSDNITDATFLHTFLTLPEWFYKKCIYKLNAYKQSTDNITDITSCAIKYNQKNKMLNCPIYK